VRGVAALVPALVILLCSSGSSAATATTTLRVVMYGDSVMLGARDQLLARFAGLPVTVDAVEDRSLLGAIDLFRRAGAGLGDVVVLDLGYNDEADPAVFRGRIDDAMTALAGVQRVIWLNQHDWGPGRAAMNDELSAAASRYPNLDVVDWNAEVAAHPEDVYADSIHLTPPGQTAMAALVRQHYDHYVESLAPTTTTSSTTSSTTTTTRAPRTTGGRVATAARRGSGGAGDGAPWELYAGGVALVLLVAGSALSVGRRAARRSGHGARRAR
jgi:hypothetical protein